MNLLILIPGDLISDDQYKIAGARFEHITDILKLGVGNQLQSGILNGPIGTATIEKLGRTDLVVSFSPSLGEAGQDKPSIELICALPRPQTVKKILEIAGTWGIKKIDFIRANRVERSYYQSPLLQAENMLPFLLEGMSQGKQTRLPEIEIHTRFRSFFEDEFPLRLSDRPAGLILPDPNALRNLDSSFDSNMERTVIAIGPEGGWVDFELELMKSLGFLPFRIGTAVLRVESAVIATLAQVELLQGQKPTQGN